MHSRPVEAGRLPILEDHAVEAAIRHPPQARPGSGWSTGDKLAVEDGSRPEQGQPFGQQPQTGFEGIPPSQARESPRRSARFERPARPIDDEATHAIHLQLDGPSGGLGADCRHATETPFAPELRYPAGTLDNIAGGALRTRAESSRFPGTVGAATHQFRGVRAANPCSAC
jgi:hypothetical protein